MSIVPPTTQASCDPKSSALPRGRVERGLARLVLHCRDRPAHEKLVDGDGLLVGRRQRALAVEERAPVAVAAIDRAVKVVEARAIEVGAVGLAAATLGRCGSRRRGVRRGGRLCHDDGCAARRETDCGGARN
jgi:hypothetical protein